MAASCFLSSSTCHPPTMTMSTCMTEMARGTHQFKIIGYSLQKGIGVGQFIASGTFEVGGYEWTIRCYPDGDSKDADGYLSVFLKLMSTANNVKASFSFKIVDPSGRSSSSIYRKASKPDIFNPPDYAWGYKKFVEITKLESQYVTDDCLTLQCTVEVVKESRTGGTKHYFITVPPSNISQHLFQFLESKQGADVTFQVEETTFDAHKLVLAMRSPVFNAEFFGPMKEKSLRYIRIDDMEAAVFKALLHFIYTDTLPPMDDLVHDSANKGTTTKLAHRLLVAADRYDLERMRLMCENMLCETIDVETVATTLKLADQHHCHHLIAFCIEYIASPEVLNIVMATEDFQDFKKSRPLLLEEILEKVGSFYKTLSS